MLVTMVFSFLYLLNQGAAQLAARGEVHVITKVMGSAESICSSSLYPPDAAYPNSRY